MYEEQTIPRARPGGNGGTGRSQAPPIISRTMALIRCIVLYCFVNNCPLSASASYGAAEKSPMKV